MKRFLLIFFLLPFFTQAQTPNEDMDGVILKITRENSNIILSRYFSTRNTENYDVRWLINTTNLVVIKTEDDEAFYQWCLNQPEVESVQKNLKIETRKKPNDPYLSSQYALDLIKAFDTWNITTGGKDYAGDDIVIGVIDNGFLIDHEDLVANIFINKDEIPGDGIDNDNNGYKDDYMGWNQSNNSGIHSVKSHGTSVIGVIGAEGDNNRGISGVNWNIKILPVTTGENVAAVVESYHYFLNMKKLYNTSGGTKGANILVVSYSGGLPNGFPHQSPAWCEVYDLLGKEGVLSVASTTNELLDVDKDGDLPSTCPSPYLLIVNSTGKSDEMTPKTGYGSTSVDISAPGEVILSTDLESSNFYGTSSGTSLSTPMVAGAAALLYSLPCKGFYDYYTKYKSDGVLVVKNALMSGADKRMSLVGKTVSEGRLNIFNAMNIILSEHCGGAITKNGPLEITGLSVEGHNLVVDFTTPENEMILLKIFDMAGREYYSTSFDAPVFGRKFVELSLNSLPDIPGLYAVSIISGKKMASKTFFVPGN